MLLKAMDEKESKVTLFLHFLANSRLLHPGVQNHVSEACMTILWHVKLSNAGLSTKWLQMKVKGQ